MNSLENTGERYIPWDSDVITHYEHLHRYRFAKAFVAGKKVLDLGCGEGYGSRILSESAKRVTGLDVDPICVTHASGKYGSGIEFITGSMTNVPISGSHVFDVIVCFEALEHIAAHDALMAEVKRLIAPDGIFIVSTPDKLEYSDRDGYHNPFHTRELYKEEFTAFLYGGFKHVMQYGQKICCGSGIFPMFENDSKECAVCLHCRDEVFFVERNCDEFKYVSSGGSKARYHIAIASDRPISFTWDGSALPGNMVLLDNSDTLLNEMKACHEGNRWLQEEKKRMVSEYDEKLREKENLILRLEGQFRDLETKNQEMARERDMMKNSKTWRAAEFVRRIFRKVAG